MKTTLTILFAAAAFGSCTGPKFTVTGRNGLVPGDSVFLFAGDRSILASGVIAPDTTFTFKGALPAPDIASVSDRLGTTEPVRIFLEPGTIHIIPQDGGGYRVTGTRLNDRADSVEQVCRRIAADLREETLGGGDAAKLQRLAVQRDSVISAAIDANCDNLLGAWLFAGFRTTGAPETVRAGLAGFPPEIQAHPILRSVAQRLEAIERTAVGQPFTDLSLPDADGTTVALSSLVGSGHWVLLDFWATWCGPCCREIPRLREAFAAYADKGFRIYAVSLDNDTAKWLSFTAANDMPWVNVSGIGPDKRSTAVSLYGITSIPTNFLISPEGVIAAKNLRGGQLKDKLAKVVK